MIERHEDIQTPSGAMATFICYPDEGGPFPRAFIYMDAPGMREELRDMARRLATSGYYVMLPDLYYRDGGSGQIDREKMARADPDERAKMFGLMRNINCAKINDDTRVMLDFSAGDDAAQNGKAAIVGYCMSGPFVISALADFPDEIACAASIHGANLVTDKEDSPHLMLARIKGELYFGCAETDDYAPPEHLAILRELMASGPGTYRMEIYPGTEHGYVFPQRAVYQRAGAEQHWQRCLEIFRRTVG